MIRVLVVDDSAVLRQSTKFVLESDSGLKVVGKARNGEEVRPPVDLGEALEVVGDDVELLQAVAEMSLEECPEQVEALREALTGQDARRASKMRRTG